MLPIKPIPQGRKTIYEYNGEIYPSKEEIHFLWWCVELKDAGYINNIEYQPESFLLSSKVNIEYKTEKKLKNSTRTETKIKTLLDGSSYTPDFELSFNFDAGGKLYFDFNRESVYDKLPPLFSKDFLSNKCLIEVKPSDYDPNNMCREFVLKQKAIYQKYGAYVNLIKIPSFFEKTFYPSRYMYTDVSLEKRKIKGNVRTVEQYLTNLK